MAQKDNIFLNKLKQIIMSKEILNQIEDLAYSQTHYAVLRDDGQIASITKDKTKIPEIIRDEYCGVKVKLIKLTYNKQPMDYTLEVELEDEDGDVDEYEFTIATVTQY